MLPFLLRRALSSLVVMFCVVSLAFLLIRSIKGGPFEREKTPAHIVAAMEAKYQLNGSLGQQYLAYLNRLAHLDLGPSAKYRDWQVAEILAQKLPNSVSIGTLAFLLASTLGVLLGGLAAMHKDRTIDRLAMLASVAAISLPSFITGPVLIALFGLWLGWLPVGGWGTSSQMVLPTLCLAAPYTAYVARLMRNSLLDVLKSDFLRTARAKGLSETAAVTRHAAKIALLPVITYLGPLAAHLLTGSMIIESVFNISGMGSVFVNSIQNRDVFLLGGAVIVLCALLVLFNLIVDILYTLLDKRIRLDQ
ncbi:MAG: ABC transporter permease [Prosthecobacter sp.]|jgi:oligopeptide transport system permease protein